MGYGPITRRLTAPRPRSKGWGIVDHPRARAVTLVEMILAIMITSMLALGVASILFAASYGTSSSRQMRQMAVRCEQVRNRLDDAVRNGCRVLAYGDSYVLLWMGDTRENDAVNLSEMQLIELADGQTTLKSYTAKFPDGWTDAQREAADTQYADDADFASEAQTAKADDYFPATPWANKVTQFAVSVDSPGDLTQVRLVTWSFTLTDEELEEQLVGTSSIRALKETE